MRLTRRLCNFSVSAATNRAKDRTFCSTPSRDLIRKWRRRTSFSFAGRVLDESFFAELQARAAPIGKRPSGTRPRSRGFPARSRAIRCARLSSRDETMPISIIEAMGLGRVVISANVGGIAEWLRDGLNGWLVPAEEPERSGAGDQKMCGRPGAAEILRRIRASNICPALHTRAFRKGFRGGD